MNLSNMSTRIVDKMMLKAECLSDGPIITTDCLGQSGFERFLR